jgi:multisubunit Na+/H+ antiporter MnhG subunit
MPELIIIIPLLLLNIIGLIAILRSDNIYTSIKCFTIFYAYLLPMLLLAIVIINPSWAVVAKLVIFAIFNIVIAYIITYQLPKTQTSHQ